MTVDVIAAGGLLVTLLGCTWHLSAKITSIEALARGTKQGLADHDKRDDRRFGEVFRYLNAIVRQKGIELPPSFEVDT